MSHTIKALVVNKTVFKNEHKIVAREIEFPCIPSKMVCVLDSICSPADRYILLNVECGIDGVSSVIGKETSLGEVNRIACFLQHIDISKHAVISHFIKLREPTPSGLLIYLESLVTTKG